MFASRLLFIYFLILLDFSSRIIIKNKSLLFSGIIYSYEFQSPLFSHYVRIIETLDSPSI